LPEGYAICLVFLKLFERIYAPLTAGLLQPFSPDNKLQQQRLSQLDKLYQRVVQALVGREQPLQLYAAKTVANPLVLACTHGSNVCIDGYSRRHCAISARRLGR
jgi:hypothetical protein